jgi:activating molecule in BECN1-regulated autophagy protein 1
MSSLSQPQHSHNYSGNSRSNNSSNSSSSHRLPSPSSVRRQYEDDLWKQQKQHQRRQVNAAVAMENITSFSDYYYLSEEQDLDTTLGEAWDIPTKAEMQRRELIRQDMQQDIIRHRPHQPSLSFDDKGRSIVHVLNDRSVYGSQHRLPLKRPKTGPTGSVDVDVTTTSAVPSPSNNIFLQQQSLEASTPSSPVEEPSLETHSAENQSHDDASIVPIPSTADASSSSFYFPFPSSDNITREIRTFAEYTAVTDYQSSYFTHLGGTDGYEDDPEDETSNHQGEAASSPPPPPRLRRRPRPASSKAVSTISVAFSPDGQTQASTHGDHTVKITQCASGILLKTLHGHPRTPWTVKYHPKLHHILASGCLGHQVRIWNYLEGVCLQMIRLEFAIISLSFHPTSPVLAVANGTRLHFWAYQNLGDEDDNEEANEDEGGNRGDDGNSPSTANAAQSSSRQGNTRTSSSNHSSNSASRDAPSNDPSPQQPRGVLTEVEQRHMLRCVNFLPDGRTLIVGGVNPNHQQQQRRGGMSGGGMSFYLRLWDFDVQAALNPNLVVTGTTGLRRRAISNVSTKLLFCCCWKWKRPIILN